MKIIVPLGIQTIAAELAGANQTRIVRGALRKKKDLAIEVFCLQVDFICQLFEKGERRVIQDRMDRVEPQGIEVKFGDPIESVFDEVAPDMVALGAVKIDGRAPGRLVTLGEIGGELGEVIAFGSEVVVNHVQNRRQASLMTRVDESLESRGSAIRILHGKGVYAVVAPVPVAGKLGDGHELNGRDAEILKLVQVRNDGLEGPFGGEGPDMQLVDHVVLKGKTEPARVLPRK